MPEQETGWRIGQFAARVGVVDETLRAWERRYGLLQPARTESGYRLYTPHDEDRVRLMQAHMRRGMAPAQAARLAVAEVASPTAPPSQLREQLLDAVAAYDAEAIDAALEQAFATGRVPAVRDVVLPVLAEVGERWAEAQVTVGQEHLTTHLVERRLLAIARDWDEGGGPQALLACPSGERHTLGLVCFGIALAEHGWRISYLGAD